MITAIDYSKYYFVKGLMNVFLLNLPNRGFFFLLFSLLNLRFSHVLCSYQHELLFCFNFVFHFFLSRLLFLFISSSFFFQFFSPFSIFPLLFCYLHRQNNSVNLEYQLLMSWFYLDS